MLLLLKITLAPLLVAAVTLLARKWGPRAGGLLMGLPLTTGPIFLFLAIDQGPDFAARATVGILFGVVGLVAFASAYATASGWTGWGGSLALATGTFLAASLAASAGIGRLESDVVEAGLAAWVVAALAASLIRRPGPGAAAAPPPWWDLWVRMLAAAALTPAITAAAGTLGPVLSGIVGSYPVVNTVVMTFTHAQLGRDAVLVMARCSVLSWMAFASCFVAIGLSLRSLGLAIAIGLGVLAAVATSVLVLWVDRRVAFGAFPASLSARRRG